MANLTEKRAFDQGINSDDSLTKLEPGEYLNGFNFRGDTSEAGHISGLQPIPGTTLLQDIPQDFPPFFPTYFNIGGCVDEERKRILFFNCGGLFAESYIGCWDIVNKVGYRVLIEGDVNGGLNWLPTSYIHSAFVVNGILYWTDNISPRRINIDAGIKMHNPGYVTSVTPYTAIMNQSVITWIRRQPGLPPTFTKITQAGLNGNQMARDAFQYCYRYIYRENEVSTLSGMSLLASENADGDTYNRHDVYIPLGEKIDQDVIQIDLVAVFLTSGNYFVINSWKTSVAADAAAIAAHNAGTTPLTFSFYNDRVGIALDSAYSVKIYDSLPIAANTVERAKNRSFMGGATQGYDSPLVTSLAFSTISEIFPPGGGGVITGEWFLLQWTTFAFVNHSAYVLRTTIPVGAQPPAAFYYYTWSTVVPPYPPTINAIDLTFRGATPTTAALSIGGQAPFSVVTTDQSNSTIVNTSFTPVSAVVGKAFKTRSAYQLSASFKDFAGRETGIVTNSTLTVQIPNTGFDQQKYVISLQWSLNNANALNEIPKDAAYYSINITKCLLTRFFIESRGTVIYADKDSSGNYTFTTTAYGDNLAGVAIDTSFLLTHGQGYVFNDGDIVSLYVNATYYTLKLVAQSGKYIICQLANVGTISAQSGLYEIFTPYKQQADEPHFEVAEIYPVLNPGQSTRAYSQLSGFITGDVFLINRTNSVTHYITEAMNCNDDFYKIWNTDAGRPNFKDDIGQVYDKNAVCFSNLLVQGSKINGLSTFDALDKVDLPLELGSISKLILTSKIQKEGTVMLAICVSETVSLYLGEVQVAAPQGNAFLATDNNVIGTIYPLKGSYGTINPEGVKQYRGVVFFPDAYNGVIVQYSDNGLEPVSHFKTRTFWRRWFNKYLTLSQQDIINLGSPPFIVGGIDPFNGEYLLSLPKLEATNPAGMLPGSIIGAPQNLFNMYDGNSKTMTYKIEKNKWLPAYSYYSEAMINTSNLLFGLSGGRFYLHNDSASGYNQFYGITYPSVIMFTGNMLPNSPKLPKSINIEVDIAPGACLIYNTYPYQQITDIQPSEWNYKEGIYYATVQRNRIDPSFTDPDAALISGEQLLAKAPMIQLSFIATGLFNLRYVNIGYQISSGHKTIATQ